MRVVELLSGLVPTTKIVGVLTSVIATSFLAGVGFILTVGDTAEVLAMVPEVVAAQEAMEGRMDSFQLRLDSADRDRTQILCLVRITVEGEDLSPLEVNRRCP